MHPCCHEEARSLPEIKALVLPDVLHYPNDLQSQHVLPQICEGRWITVNISCFDQLSNAGWSRAVKVRLISDGVAKKKLDSAFKHDSKKHF